MPFFMPTAANIDAVPPPLRHADVVTWSRRGRQAQGEAWHSELRCGTTVAVCTYRRAASLGRFLESLGRQDFEADALLIIDASPDAETEQLVCSRMACEALAEQVTYVRVTGALRGLTRQRNLALQLAATDLIAFFDDDILLEPGCLQELEAAHRRFGREVVGVGAWILDEAGPSSHRLWRIRRLLGIVGSLQPGRYCRSGMSLPWSLIEPPDGVVDGDWLPGGCVMWRTDAARSVQFHEAFCGYAQGEDLDFSLRVRKHGRLVMHGAARVRHEHELSGRPNHYKLGYMAIYNRYHIHRRGLPDRRRRDAAWFIYAWSADTLLLARHLLFPRRWWPTLQQIGGRMTAACHLVCAPHRENAC